MALCHHSQLLGPSLPKPHHPTSQRKLAPTPTTLSLSSPNPKPSSSQNPNPNPPTIPSSQNALNSLTKSLAVSSATALLFHLTLSNGNGDGFFGGSGGGGGAGDGGNFWSKFFSPLAFAKDEGSESSQDWDSHGLPGNIVVQLNKLSAFKRYRVSEILFFDQRRRTTVGTEDSFFEMVSLRPGGVYTKAHLQKELETLATCGMFEKVDLDGRTKPDGTLAVTISFTESTWQSADAFRCINVGLLPQSKPIEMDPDMTDREKMEYFRSQEKDYRRRIERARPCLLPIPVQREVLQMLREQGKVSARLLQRIRDRVQKWYHDEGYACAQVVNFGNLNTREVVCEVVEGDITQLAVQFQDKLGNVCEGNTQLPVVYKELPKQLRQGHVFNIEAGKQALRNINSLALFSNIEVNPRPDEKNEGGIIVEIKLKELEQKSAEVSTEWSIVPGRQGRPTLASIQPGGTVSFEHRNLKGLNRSILGSVTSSNLLNPQDDLSFKLEYVHPYLDGVYNPRNRTFRTSCFNSRKLSPVFTGGPGVDEVPAIWVDRVGFKANITESFTRQSKFTYGLVMEEITTRDETSSICTNGSRALPSGGLSMDGPPTTLSGTGIDRMAFAQANITRDNTKFVNGTIVGERNVFQLDQGLGIGSNFPFFNRHQLIVTRFIQLKPVEEGAGKPPPPVLVLHGHYGGCVGDLPSYDAFTLGGPYSVRGYNMGELGACRNILELAAELRVPIRNTHVYAFAEHGNDLGSSKDVKGNPTEFFRRVGQGSSYGVGVKLGLVRAEYAVDHNAGTGAVFFRFGERF
ncbi:protein TOC75-3, chloroplastic [Magnolia sinica]|uniref:protein TOC75-3, chloroplastic n=1 Tax=Magnolia sinica TaxID=86752 RepID=UPI00265A69C7|nr:protein TOC75-3, chloroplastic [Magnolia sinica]